MIPFTLPPTFNAGVNYYPSSPATVDGNRNRFIDAAIWVQMWPDIGEGSLSVDTDNETIEDETHTWVGDPVFAPAIDPYSGHKETTYTSSRSGSTSNREFTVDPMPPPLEDKLYCTGNPTLGPLFATLTVNVMATGTDTSHYSEVWTPDIGADDLIDSTNTDPSSNGFAVFRFDVLAPPAGYTLEDYLAMGITDPEGELWVVSLGGMLELLPWGDFDAGGSAAGLAYNFSDSGSGSETEAGSLYEWSFTTENHTTASVSWS